MKASCVPRGASNPNNPWAGAAVTAANTISTAANRPTRKTAFLCPISLTSRPEFVSYRRLARHYFIANAKRNCISGRELNRGFKPCWLASP